MKQNYHSSCKICKREAKKKGMCNHHYLQEWRKKNEERNAYHTLKNNAKRRYKDFDLTFEEFRIFAQKVGYFKKKGIYAESLHIDRIDEKKGYTLDNIQVLTNSENVRKYLKYEWNGQEMEANVITIKNEKIKDLPF